MGYSSPSWIVTGHIRLMTPDGHPLDNNPALQSALISYAPQGAVSGNTFEIKVPEVESRLPAIVIRMDKFGTETFDVNDPSNVKIDWGFPPTRSIIKPITLILGSPTPYNSTAPQSKTIPGKP